MDIHNIEIIRSRKRRRTVSARMVNERMLVSVPVHISDSELKKIIGNFQRRFELRRIKRQTNQQQDLKDISARLNKEYFGGRLKIHCIEYVTDQTRKYGCCNFKTRSIRISHRLAQMPQWVRDYVIIHEMAHLIEPNHSKSFWNIVSRYKLAERARGFLLAKGLADENEDD